MPNIFELIYIICYAYAKINNYHYEIVIIIFIYNYYINLNLICELLLSIKNLLQNLIRKRKFFRNIVHLNSKYYNNHRKKFKMNNFDNSRKTKPIQTSVKTNLDDWETDPDFVSDMDEMDQRWGSKHRTVGSINMSELMDEVRKDHKTMTEKLNHSSQKDYSGGFGGKFGIQHDRKDKSALDYDYHEQLSKHTSQEIKREIITSSSIIKGSGPNQSIVSDAKKSFLEKTSENSYHQKQPPSNLSSSTSDTYNNSKPKVSVKTFLQQDNSRPIQTTTTTTKTTSHPTVPPKQTFLQRDTYPVPKYEESSVTKRILKEEKSSSSSMSTSKQPIDVSPAFKSIQEKIDAFKREFEDIESKVAKKSDLSKVIGKTTKFDKSHSNVEYVSRDTNPQHYSTSNKPSIAYTTKSTSSTNVSSQPRDFPKTNIKSLSERFETLGRDDNEDFKRKTEMRRKEFFDQIKNQVRETRKELDGFDPIDEDDLDNDEQYKGKENPTTGAHSERMSNLITSSQQQQRYSPVGSKQEQRFIGISSPVSPQSTSRPSSRLSSDSQASTIRPKVYTKRETTEERIISKIVKENDKIIEDETKRDVKRSSSCHGSSDDEQYNQHLENSDNCPRSIRIIGQNLKSSPVQRTESPVDRLKRENPIVAHEIKGAGLMARTLYDYQAVESDELTFDVDDLITNIEKVDKGWYKGTISYKNGDKQTGLFPANYVKLLNDDDGEY